MNLHMFKSSGNYCCGTNTYTITGVKIKPHYFCKACAKCEEAGCKEQSRPSEHTDFVPSPLDFEKIRTQKAKGVCVLNYRKLLARNQGIFGQQLNVVPILKLISSENDLQDAYKKISFAKDLIFARPCPLSPKHGFVDSRLVQSGEALTKVWQETKQADPDGELLLMPMQKAKSNAILTLNTLIYGPGNDGATSGKNSKTFGVMPVAFEKETLKIAGIKESPYVEAVYTESESPYYDITNLTQLRNGPLLVTTPDYIPVTMKAQEIMEITGDEDLIEWDKKITSLSGSNSFVVYHRGGSLGCHYGIHCYINKVAYVTTHKPAKGDLLKKTKNSEPLDYRKVQQGLGFAFSKEFTKLFAERVNNGDYHSFYKHTSAGLFTILYCLHNISALRKENSALLGLAIGLAVRLGIIAGQGEARHLDKARKVTEKTFHISDGGSREKIYHLFVKEFERGITDLLLLEKIFSDAPWRGSYGGKNWAHCVRQTINLYNLALSFYKRPCQKLLAPVISQLNELINAVHNGGHFLNKFDFMSHSFDMAKASPGFFALIAAPQISSIEEMLPRVDIAEYSFKSYRKVRNALNDKQQSILDAIVDGYMPEEMCDNCGEYLTQCDCDVDE